MTINYKDRLSDPSLIKQHPFFRGVDFHQLHHQSLPDGMDLDMQSLDQSTINSLLGMLSLENNLNKSSRQSS